MGGENNGNPYQNGWFGGTTISGNIHIHYTDTSIWRFIGNSTVVTEQSGFYEEKTCESWFQNPNYSWS